MSWLNVLIGIVIGVFLASHSPEVADHIRHYSLELMEAIQGIIRK
ncbi:hypothetical protein THF1C08_50219 [Vibrio jasicida]|jgi:hypothetical protein|uniref:Uncharacterized protein n=1 Tax=Vibrio jasicida TaxID=766224 RepID=A0AAU9QTC9_9VIBR|nr:hypothetical protein THF1C08_50219 [Vibrio jasicida]CAH1601607.1 hypothetical protein THF1A12_50127 [Vibrio jasicida]